MVNHGNCYIHSNGGILACSKFGKSHFFGYYFFFHSNAGLLVVGKSCKSNFLVSKSSFIQMEEIFVCRKSDKHHFCCKIICHSNEGFWFAANPKNASFLITNLFIIQMSYNKWKEPNQITQKLFCILALKCAYFLGL